MNEKDWKRMLDELKAIVRGIDTWGDGENHKAFIKAEVPKLCKVAEVAISSLEGLGQIYKHQEDNHPFMVCENAVGKIESILKG